MKHCTVCKILKPFSDFGKRASKSDGLRSECKECNARAASEYRSKHPERFKASQKRYYDSHREARIVNARSWNVRNSDRVKSNMLKSLRLNAWHKQLASRAKGTAKKKGLDFDLDSDFVLSLYEKQGRRCYWLDIPFSLSVERRNPLQPSLDRLDCSKGYTRDNVVLSCQFANMGRSEMGADRFRQFVADLELYFQSRSRAVA